MKRFKPKATVQILKFFITVFCAGSALADEVYNDDLIVVGSGCIGLDCSDGLTFNGHELVLKENNLRIAFGSAEKFRLSANHTANGGASEFRLDQIIPTQNVTDESAFFRNGNAQLIGAVSKVMAPYLY